MVRAMGPRCDELAGYFVERARLGGLVSYQFRTSCHSRATGLCRDVSFVANKDAPMLAFQIIGGIFVLLFIAAAMTGIEGTEHR